VDIFAMSGALGLINLHYIVKIKPTETPDFCQYLIKNT